MLISIIRWSVCVFAVAGFVDSRHALAQEQTSEQATKTLSGATYLERMKAAELAEGDPGGLSLTVRGVIRDSEGNPVPGALVVLREGSSSRISSGAKPMPIGSFAQQYLVNDVFARTTTNGDGEYAFENAMAPAVNERFRRQWNWSVVAASPRGEFGWRRLETKYTGPAKVKLEADVDLRRTKPVSGTVLSVDGNPVAGALLSISSLQQPNPDGYPLRSPEDFDGNASSLQLFAKSDKDGGFVFPSIPVGISASLFIRHPDHEFSGAQVVAGESKGIQAIPRVSVRGRVVDESGSPIAGAHFSGRGHIAYALTDERGEFSWPTTRERLLRFVPQQSPEDAKASFDVSFPDGDFVRTTVEFALADLVAGKKLTVVLKRGCRISGTVLSASDGKPVEGVTVAVNPVDATDTLNLRLTRTDAEGKYDLLVQPGHIAVGISGPIAGFDLPRSRWPVSLQEESSLVRHLEVTIQEPTTLDPFLVKPIANIRVLVVDQANQPVENATVETFYQASRGPNTRVSFERELTSPGKTDRKGMCRLLPTVDAWGSASVRVRAYVGGEPWFGMQPLDRKTIKNPITVRLKRGWIMSGRVVVNGKPASGISVRLSRRVDSVANSYGAFTSRSLTSTTTDREGNYRFVAAPKESYMVSATVPGNRGLGQTVSSLELVKDNQYRFHDIEVLTPGAKDAPIDKIKGRVVDYDGTPVSGARVSSMQRLLAAGAETDNDGRFEIDVPRKPEPIRLSIRSPNRDRNKTFNSAAVMAAAGDDDVKVMLDSRLTRVVSRLDAVKVVDIAAHEKRIVAGELTVAGNVLDEEDRPLVGAVVRINGAKRRPGPGENVARIKSHPAHPDCGKTTKTDEQGEFQIKVAASDVLFDVAIGARGYLGNVLQNIDPNTPARTATLVKVESIKPEHLVSARLVDSEGNGIGGATIEVRPVIYMDGRVRGPDAGITAATVTGNDGKFTLKVARPIRRMTLKIGAGGFASITNNSARPGRALNDIQLSRGGSIRGRLIADGQPAAGVKMELVQADRSIGNAVTPMFTTTNQDGEFRWDHLNPTSEFAIYSLVDQNLEAGLPVTLVNAPDSDKLADLGDIETQKGHQLALRFITEDRKPLPGGSYCYLSRSKAWTSGRKTIPGKFAATVRYANVPQEVVEIGLRVAGYEVVNVKPPCQLDLNRRYRFYCDEDKSLTFTLRPVVAKE